MKTPTPTAVAAEVALLKLQRPHLPPSAFGDDNQAACSAQIFVLENKLTEYQIYDRYESEDEEERDEQCLSDALQAGRWLRGEDAEAPSKGWEPIVNRTLGKFKK